MSRRSFIREGGHFVPRVLYEPDDLKYRPDACPQCGGSGTQIERLDEERYDCLVPCWACQTYCKACDKHVAKKGHECVPKEKA
jgi:hypothetical protein